MKLKITMKNNFFYKGTAESEDEEILVMIGEKGNRIELRKSEISVREELD